MRQHWVSVRVTPVGRGWPSSRVCVCAASFAGALCVVVDGRTSTIGRALCVFVVDVDQVLIDSAAPRLAGELCPGAGPRKADRPEGAGPTSLALSPAPLGKMRNRLRGAERQAFSGSSGRAWMVRRNCFGRSVVTGPAYGPGMGKRGRKRAPAAPALQGVPAGAVGAVVRRGGLPPDVREAALEELETLAGEMLMIRSRLDRKVRAARLLGVSWHDLGLALGMTGEGVRRRYVSRGGSR